MQDRLKFRFWHKPTNKMLDCYGFNEHCTFANTLDGIGTEYNPCATKDCVLMQCTGLKDKNGKLIYEGDILRYPPENKDEEKNYVACEVFFHNNDCCDNHIGFQMNRYRFQGCLCGIANYGTRYKFIPKNTERMEVIGNIYETQN